MEAKGKEKEGERGSCGQIRIYDCVSSFSSSSFSSSSSTPPRPLPLLVVGATLFPPPSLLPPLPNFDNQINWKVFLGPEGGEGGSKA